MELEIINRGTIKVMGKAVRTRFWKMGLSLMFHLAWLDLTKMHEKIPDQVDDNVYYGINIDFYKKKGIVSYLFGAEVSTYKNTPPGMETRTLPPSCYVKLHLVPKDEELKKALHIKGKANYGNMAKAGYQYLTDEWLADSPYERADMSENFELYFLDELKEGIYICVPIQKKMAGRSEEIEL